MATPSKKRIRNLRLEEVLIAPRSPWRNPLVERLIGSIRREGLDHVVVLNERDLRRMVSNYLDSYHHSRKHLALDMDCLERREVQDVGRGRVIVVPEVGGLHPRYERCAA
jgi:putative transposase